MDLKRLDLTNSDECRTLSWNEYQQRRLTGYHQGETQKSNRDVTRVELWRRLRDRPTSATLCWHFDKDRQIGDILDIESRQYTEGLSVHHAAFSNCPVPPR
jgi:hypothetical protein